MSDEPDDYNEDDDDPEDDDLDGYDDDGDDDLDYDDIPEKFEGPEGRDEEIPDDFQEEPPEGGAE